MNQRSCESCTKCCEGWLRGNVDNTPFYPGSPCKFCITSKGCSNYQNRPYDPCISYNCEWINDPSIPEWIKPSAANVLISSRKVGPFNCVELLPAGAKLDSNVLSWFIFWGLKKYGNIIWLNEYSEKYYLGSEDFCSFMSR